MGSRIGILGTGRMATAHVAALRLRPGSRLSVGSADRDRAQAFAAHHGIERFGTFEEVLANPLDGVIIATHTSLHAGQLRQSLPLGIPVFCEKPLTLDAATSSELVHAYAAAEVPLQVGFHRRFDPGFRFLREEIASGRVGQLYSIVLTARDHDVPPAGYVATSGGIFRDMHIHDFDSALWLTAQPARQVTAHGSCLTGGEVAAAGDFDVSTVVVELASGVLVTIVGGRRNAVGYDTRAEVYGSDASLALGLGPSLAARRLDTDESRHAKWQDFAARYAEAYDRQMASFVALCQGAGENEAPAEASVIALLLAEAAERSVRSREGVSLETGAT